MDISIFATLLTIVNILLFGAGIYTLFLVIKALRIYIRLNEKK